MSTTRRRLLAGIASGRREPEIPRGEWKEFAGWETHEVRPSATPFPWKESTGLACPHGREIFLVDGTYVRNHFDSDMVQGGNGYRYRFCPKRELWVEAAMPEEEVPLVAFHECYEAELMRQGWSYEDAHDAAKRVEDRFRRGRPVRRVRA